MSEALREDWFNAPDLAAQKQVCEKVQLQAFQSVPFVPVGQWFQPWAYRKTLRDFVRCGNILFWNVQRA